ncbi:hypothetical protein TNCV_697461 [Trichonephila clavipes]|nr:hypothetical protein TNCV_697461 [Trichonephila clavipes]
MEKRCHSLQEVGLLPVGPRKVFYFPSTTHWKPMEAFPYPPPGDAPSRGYRLPRGRISNLLRFSKSAIEAIRNGETNISCDIITLLEQLHSKRKSCILQWIPAHVNIEDLQLTPNPILEYPTVATKLLKMGMVPLRNSLRELLYSPDAPRIAEAVIKTFDGI